MHITEGAFVISGNLAGFSPLLRAGDGSQKSFVTDGNKLETASGVKKEDTNEQCTRLGTEIN